MKYKMLATDLDGTLLNKNHLLSDGNLLAIKRLLKEEKYIVFSTGRPPLAVEQFYQSISNTSYLYLIAFNGAIIKHLFNQKILYEKTMRECDIKNIASFAFEKNLSSIFYSESYIISQSKSTEALNESMFIGLPLVIEKNLEVIVSNHKIYKGLIMGDVDKLHEEKNEFEKRFDESLECSFSNPHFWELNSLGTNKGDAISRLLEKMELETEVVVAVGDGDNDVELMKVVGKPLAVSNASVQLKKFSEDLGVSNNSDVIEVIDKKFF